LVFIALALCDFCALVISPLIFRIQNGLFVLRLILLLFSVAVCCCILCETYAYINTITNITRHYNIAFAETIFFQYFSLFLSVMRCVPLHESCESYARCQAGGILTAGFILPNLSFSLVFGHGLPSFTLLSIYLYGMTPPPYPLPHPHPPPPSSPSLADSCFLLFLGSRIKAAPITVCIVECRLRKFVYFTRVALCCCCSLVAFLLPEREKVERSRQQRSPEYSRRRM